MLWVIDVDLHNLTGDNTIISISNNLEGVEKLLALESDHAIEWSKSDSILANPGRFKAILTIPHINSESNPPPFIFNVVCKYLRQYLGTSFGVATLPIYCNIE